MNHIHIYPDTIPDTDKIGLRVKVPVPNHATFSHEIAGWLAEDGTIGEAQQFDNETEASTRAHELRAELTDASKPTVDGNHFILANEAVSFERGPLTDGEQLPVEPEPETEAHDDGTPKRSRRRKSQEL